MLKTVNEHIRQSILKHLGYREELPHPKDLYTSEWSDEFEVLMRNRLVMGALRYGLFADHDKVGGSAYDNVTAAINRLELYRETGNTEHLVDAANHCLCEFRVGIHPNKHFSAADDAHHMKLK